MEVERTRTLLQASNGLSNEPRPRDGRASSTAVLEALKVKLSILLSGLQSLLEVGI